jgi:adenine-specific DNA-methyltransferase
MIHPRFETADLTAENIAKIAALFPSVITEALDEEKSTPENRVYKKAVNFEALKTLLGDEALSGDEAYEFTWVGKKASFVEASRPIRKTLRPCKEESRDWDTTQNLYIEGDNLEALKLLQKSYFDKVKMIYIDPPYNTGNDFVYRDNFRMNKDEYDREAGVFDEEENRLFRNKESNGRFHSDWCSMIYPRLLLARNLLSDAGVIFISIDDNEVAQLRKICDEVFWEGNFIGNIVWQKKYGPANDSTAISSTHDHILVYAKSILTWIMGLIPRNDDQLGAFKNPDNDPRGFWRASDLSAKTYTANCDYVIVSPTGKKFRPPASRSWIVNKQRYTELLADNRITFGTSGNGRPMQKTFLSEVRQGITPETWWDREFADDNKNAKYEMKALFPENIFDTPKPTKLVYRLLQVANTNNDDIILDFFSGSATTAHAVMQLNAEDGGGRKFIMAQLPESCEKDSEAFKAGYKNICEIGKERIRRAGNKIREEAGFNGQDLDIGFRVFKIADSNMKDVYYGAGEYKQEDLDLFVSNIKEDRTSLDMLYGCLLDWALPLSLPHVEEKIDGFTVHIVNTEPDGGDENYGAALVACFDENISEKALVAIAHKNPLRVVFRDAGFASDPAKINIFEIFKLHAPGTQVKVI